MLHKKLLSTALVFFVFLTACEKKNDDDTYTAGSSRSTTSPAPVVKKDSYVILNPDTFYNPTVTKYSLSTGSYVVKAYGPNNEPELYIYFKGAEPLVDSKYALIDNRSQSALNEGEAFIRYKRFGATYFNYSSDTIKIVVFGDQKIAKCRGIKFTKDGNTDNRTGSVNIVF